LTKNTITGIGRILKEVMTPKFIFLHIPKAAGTSFRAILWDITDPENRFWYGMDTSPQVNSYSELNLEGKQFIGGHKGIKFYPRDSPNLYCSLIREPVARVVSLFSYYTRPESAVDERSSKRRSKQLERWLEHGIDPTSIVRSLETCTPFRNEVENHQCAYLGREGRSFDSVLETITTNNFLVGDSNQIYLLVAQLSQMFSWPDTRTIRGNVTREGGHDGILDEPGAEELIRELCSEDQKLYDFVTRDNNGLFKNTPSETILRQQLSYTHPPDQPAFSKGAWERVKITTVSELPVKRGVRTCLDVELANKSKEILDTTHGEGLYFVYKLLGNDGEANKVSCTRTRLSDNVQAGGKHHQTIEIHIPRKFFDSTCSIRVSLLAKGKYWVEQFSNEHTATIKLCKDGE
jgi:hypothetical protein